MRFWRCLGDAPVSLLIARFLFPNRAAEISLCRERRVRPPPSSTRTWRLRTGSGPSPRTSPGQLKPWAILPLTVFFLDRIGNRRQTLIGLTRIRDWTEVLSGLATVSGGIPL